MHRRRHHQHRTPRRGGGGARRRAAPSGLRRLGSALLAALLIAVLAAGLGLHRLRQGPVSLGPVGALIEDRLAAGAPGLTFEIGEAVFALGRPGAPSGLILHDVAVRRETGEIAAAAPALAVDFHLFDLLQGRLAPTRLVLRGAEAEIRRDLEGRLRFGAAPGEVPGTAGAERRGAGEGGRDAGEDGREGGAGEGDGSAGAGPLGFLTLLDAAARGRGPLGRLRGISARDATLTLRDMATGRRWRLSETGFEVGRSGAGEVGRLSGLLAPLDAAGEGAAPPARVSLSGARALEDGRTRLALAFEALPAARLAADIARLAGPGAPPVPAEAAAQAEGTAQAELARDGRLESARADVTLGPGRLPGLPLPFARLESGRAVLDWSAERGRLAIPELALRGDAGRLTLSGEARPWAQGAAEGVALDLRLSELEVAAAAGFEGPLSFASGRVEGDLLPARGRLELRRLALASSALEAEGRGLLDWTGGGPHLALRAETGPFDVPALLRHWPLAAADKAREWVVEHLHGGEVLGATADIWLQPGAEPEVTLDFDYAEVSASPLDGLPPLEGARGAGRASAGRFDLRLDAGRVTPPGGEAIALDGSLFNVPNVKADPSLGQPLIRAEGRIADMLALLDQPPLELTRRLSPEGLDVAGRARVAARLSLPMIKELRLDEVAVASEAELRDVALRVPGAGRRLTAERLTLSADGRGLRLSGQAALDGIPARIAWTERFQPGGEDGREGAEGAGPPRREVELNAALDGAALARLGLEGLETPRGAVQAALALSWPAPEAPARLRLDADLGPAALALPDLGWRKAAGAPGRLSASGALPAGGGVRLDRLDLEAGGLRLAGSARLGADGALARLDLTRLRLDDALDVALSLRRVEGGAREVEVSGALIDLGALFARRAESRGGDGDGDGAGDGDGDGEAAGGGAGAPRVPDRAAPALRADLAVERAVLSGGVALHGARGRLVRADGVTRARLGGAVNGGAEARLRYRQGRNGAAAASLRSGDAGRLIADLGLSEAARGGRLKLRARLPADGGPTQGLAEISDIRVSEREALGQVVARAGRDGVLAPGEGPGAGGAAAPGDGGEGYLFERVEAPFALQGDLLQLRNALASGPVLGLKVDGSYRLDSGALDLSGVLTPAYAINGLFNSVPLLGELLGGEGEGLIALTFTVGGTASDPQVSANPLSILTPGVFRRVFQTEGEAEGADAPPDLFESRDFEFDD